MMFEQSDRKPQPRLLELSEDGNALKPDALDGVPITILDHLDVTTQDGRESAQWLVRTPDQKTAIYWAAGKGPTLAVRHWFRENPKTPLYAILMRRQNQWGNNVWTINQRMVDSANTDQDAEGTNAQLNAAGFPEELPGFKG